MEKMEMVSSRLPLVKDRGEWNQQTFIIRPKFEKKQRQSIDNQLEIQFPLHRDFDFVANHAMGFKGKSNVDLFKFYYRLYLKNKFAIQRIRKEKKVKDGLKKNENAKKQKLNQTEEPNTEEIRNAYKTIEIKPPSQQKQLKFVRECIQNLQQQASIVNKHLELPKLVSSQTQVKIVNINISKIPQARTRDSQLELEELMLSRVVQAIQESKMVSHEDVRKVKEIILQRHSQLSEMERELQLNEILGIKKQIYEREVAMKNEFNRPPGIDNPVNFNELSSIQEVSIMRSMYVKSLPNVSVTEYKFNNYEDEPELEDVTNKTKMDLKQKQIEETLIQEQSTEMQSILQQMRSSSLATKGNETEHSKEKTQDKNKLLPTLKFLEQAKQQIAQRSDNDTQQLQQPYFQPDIEDTSKSKVQQSLSMVSQLQNKTSKTMKSSVNRSNQLASASSNHHSNQLSLEKKQTETMRKSAYKLNEEQKARSSAQELDVSDDMKFERQNYYEMKFSQILQRVMDQKKIQGGEESQHSQTLSQVESETVQKIAQNLVSNIINIHKNPTPIMDQPSTFNYLDVDSDDQEKATQSIPVIKSEDIPEDARRHLSYNRDISHLDHTFKIESQVSLNDKRLNEEQIANIIQQISQQLLQAQIPPDQIEKQLDEVTNILLKHPINKLSSKLLKQSTTIMQNEPNKKIYLEETRYPIKPPKITHNKDQIDYLKFYEENAPSKQEKSRKSYKIQDSSKRSKPSTMIKNMSEDERKQFLASHKMNLQERANSQELDEELQFLQTVIDDQKKQREQIFTKKQSQPLQSGKNTSRDLIDFDESSEKQQNTFRSHNPPTNINYESDQIKQGQTEINFNIRRPQVKQKTDQTQNQSEKGQQMQISSQQGTQRSDAQRSRTKRSNQDEQQANQPEGSSQSYGTYKSLKYGNRESSDRGNENKEVYSPNISVEEVPHQDEYDEQTDKEDEQVVEEIQEIIDENGNVVNVVTKRTIKQPTENSKKSDPKQTERSKKSKQSGSQQLQSQINKQNPREKTQQSQYKEQEQHQEQQQQQNSSQNIVSQPMQKQISNQQQQYQQEQPSINNNEDKQIKLNLQRQDSNQNYAENSSTQQIYQQQLRNRTNLQDIQLRSYQPSQNQSMVNSSGTPQQNNTPLQPPRKQGGKKTKFEDQSSNNNNSNTPQAKLQRVKTKLSRFQEAANNNDDDDYDYDWDDEDPSNKKKKNTSKSSKSTLRNDIQSPSISPMTKQQNQATIAKKKVYDLKQEYELIAKQNLSLADLKKDIEKKISQLQSPDDEAKYNIYLYEQRQKQLKHIPQTIEGLINDKRENEDACGDTIRKFHENRMRYKDVIEKDQALKFTNQIQLDDEQQTQINTQSHLDEYMREVQMNIQRMIQQVQLEQMRDHPEVRKECFEYDSSIIQQRKMESLASEIVQTQAQMRIYEEPTQETQRKTEQLEQDCVMSNQNDKKFELLAQKLRALKFKNPDKFNQIVSTEIVKTDLFLSTTKHKYILE
ncbi:unnamed protein product (macronuclear) [Paramecium tetraurelia]|uniref:Uncharacterized protein n=1 Tax=Paramecium tetraurelia TaxID=5888 RepID=A0BFP9_PARTE|nr:uncharacterized protein GSPATT00028401001 [Paramecium tetraurelia]CAK57366.1 unnamed protein product [Paramecium tetraurelia]|eukprot:XP_001424764.1 hypothetical protein (macronuclear) [Paramecium tetraurelia strain d4-2]